MRETKGSLLQAAQDLVADANMSSPNILSSTSSFLLRTLNDGITTLYRKLPSVITQRQQTAATVEDQQFYHLPIDFGNLVSATLTVGSRAYPLEIIESQEKWDQINQVEVSGYGVPRFIYIRRDDFGIWPIPAEDDIEITMNYNYVIKDLSADDKTTGTVSTTQNAATVTGSSTAFAATDVGKWFKADDDGYWYRISAFTSTIIITLETVFEGAAVSGSSYVVGESPEVPPELHSYLPYFAAAQYLAGPKRDPNTAQTYLNYYWTGDFNNNSRNPGDASAGVLGWIGQYRQMGRGNNGLVRRRNKLRSRVDERWSITLS